MSDYIIIVDLVLIHILNIKCLLLALSTSSMDLDECPLSLDSSRSD
jgi:hypothetical protein